MYRRKFILNVAYIGSSLALPRILFKQRKKSLGVVLVGLGYYSTDLLAPALQMTKHCHLAGIVTGSPHKIPIWQRKYGIQESNIYSYDTMHRIADNDEIDVVYIVLPTGLHAQYAIKAAETGKHVWCEKPMARTYNECQDMINACAKNKVKLSIGYRMQHEKNTQRLMHWAQERPFGKIKNIVARAGYFDGRSDHWKQNKALGGGAMYDMGVYTLNAARYASGEEPTVLFAKHINKRSDIYHEVDETTEYTLQLPSGAVAECATSLGRGMNELKVVCENGTYELIPFQSYSGVGGSASDGTVLSAQSENQQATQMDNDALAILHDTAVRVPGEEGAKDIALVEEIYKCAN